MSQNIISQTAEKGWLFRVMQPLPTQNTKTGEKSLEMILGGTDYWAEPKINGHRAGYINGGLYSTRNLGVDGYQICNSERVPHIVQELNKEDPDGLMILDGELAFDIADCSNEDVATILGASPEKAQERARARALVYFIYDILRLPNGEDVSFQPLQSRRKLLDSIFTMAFTRFVIPTEIYDPTRGYDLASVMDFAKENNWEGLVFKNRKSLYHPGKRPANCWYKWKISSVVDEQVFITAILDPEMYHRDSLGRRDPERFTRLYLENLAGGVKIAQIDRATGTWIDRGRIGTWSDEQRQLFISEPDKWIGKVFDLSAFRKTDSGKFVSGKFIRWRPDLRREDCTNEEDPIDTTRTCLFDVAPDGTTTQVF